MTAGVGDSGGGVGIGENGVVAAEDLDIGLIDSIVGGRTDGEAQIKITMAPKSPLAGKENLSVPLQSGLTPVDTLARTSGGEAQVVLPSEMADYPIEPLEPIEDASIRLLQSPTAKLKMTAAMPEGSQQVHRPKPKMMNHEVIEAEVQEEIIEQHEMGESHKPKDYYIPSQEWAITAQEAADVIMKAREIRENEELRAATIKVLLKRKQAIENVL